MYNVLKGVSDMTKANNKNIGFFTLCGLIIGPILGSGIVLLPPIANNLVGDFAVFAWMIIMALGIVFAYVFIFLSLKSPGNEGVAIAVGSTLGPFWRELTANFLTTAVCFGPAAVVITAANFLKNFSFLSGVNTEIIAFCIVVGCAAVLISGVKTLSRFTLILTGFTSVLLFCGSIYTLIFSSHIHLPQTSFSFSSFGYTLLLLFWSIVGWEVVGNYIEDINNPQKTLMKAMTFSLVVIVVLYMTVALAMQSLDGEADSITAIMTPLFGSLALPIMGIIASGLCISTYLMIIGAVSRMSATRAADKRLPFFLSRLNKNGSPINAVIALAVIHSFSLAIMATGLMNISSFVTCANVFFLSNAIIGLLAGFRLLDNIKLRAAIVMLITAFTLLLLKASIWSLALLLVVTLVSIYNFKMLNKYNQSIQF